MSYQLKKAFVFFSLVILVFFWELFSLPISAYAQDIITYRTGTIRITQPDGVVLIAGKDEALPEIPSGSTIEVLSGSINVVPAAGFIQVVIGDSVSTVKAGDRVIASVDPKTKMADFNVGTGEVSIITGNTTITVIAGQEVQIGLDTFTGIVSVKSIRGIIETVTAGVLTSVLQGGFAQIIVDSQTREVHIDSTDGMVEVISLEGERTILARGESKDIQGLATGEVLAFPGEAIEISALLTEEPSEPEWPEASPHRP
jgi:hypothetical protein